MTVRLYKSTDASAPVLYGAVGSLIGVLDAVLVNGYGTQTAAGWTKPYSGTNKAVYRMATSGNTGFYLNVQDSAAGTGGAKEARAWGYETASAQDTGSGQFPTTAQLANGVFIRKSATADSTNARAWWIVADTSCFYLFIESGDYAAPCPCTSFGFGDFYTYKSGDAYNCAIIGRSTENSASFVDTFGLLNNGGGGSSVISGNYVARHWTQSGSAVQVGKCGTTFAGALLTSNMTGEQNTTPANYGLLTYPNGPDSSLVLSPIWLAHNSAVRGYLKGVWAPCHSLPLNHGDTFSGSGSMTGKSFVAISMRGFTGGSGTSGQIMLETSDTWS
jgi:hypothetical protein